MKNITLEHRGYLSSSLPGSQPYTLSTPDHPGRGDQQRAASTAGSPPRPAAGRICSGGQVLYPRVHVQALPLCLTIELWVQGIFGILRPIPPPTPPLPDRLGTC